VIFLFFWKMLNSHAWYYTNNTTAVVLCTFTEYYLGEIVAGFMHALGGGS